MNAHYSKFMKEGYVLLTSKRPKFPKQFTTEMKKNLYIKIMDYYRDKENFEYCTQLSQSLNNIENEIDN